MIDNHNSEDSYYSEIDEKSLIHFAELDYEQILGIYDQFRENFEDYDQFGEFMAMQSKLYFNGISYRDFINNIANFSMYNIMNSLRNKLGNDAIKEHTMDDGTLLYSIGGIPKETFDEFK